MRQHKQDELSCSECQYGALARGEIGLKDGKSVHCLNQAVKFHFNVLFPKILYKKKRKKKK